MKATGIVRRIDDLGRVVIPKEIRRTMRIREGDPLEIFTDKDGELIFKKYSPIGELSDFAAQICDSLRRSTDGIAAVCDRDAVIAISGGAKKELLEKPISAQLSEIMDNRAPYRQGSGGSNLPVSAADDKYCGRARNHRGRRDGLRTVHHAQKQSPQHRAGIQAGPDSLLFSRQTDGELNTQDKNSICMIQIIRMLFLSGIARSRERRGPFHHDLSVCFWIVRAEKDVVDRNAIIISKTYE